MTRLEEIFCTRSARADGGRDGFMLVLTRVFDLGNVGGAWSGLIVGCRGSKILNTILAENEVFVVMLVGFYV